MTEQNLKPGDTVDPRTLPVGAEFRYQWSQWVHRVIEVGVASELCETAQRCSFGCDPAVLVRLPQPSAEREAILWDELGTPRQKQPDCLVCGEDEIGSHFDRAWCHRCAWQGSLTALLARVAAEPKRPPCDACGEESCPCPFGKAETWDSDDTSIKLGRLYLCRSHWMYFGEEGARMVRARRAKHSSGSTGPLNGTQADSVNQHEPEANRWQTTDPTRIAALEAKLAEQVASGGQDCAPARSLVERADRLRREQEARKFPLTNGDVEGREEAWGTDPYLQPGPRLMRHELPSDQRLDRKRTGR